MTPSHNSSPATAATAATDDTDVVPRGYWRDAKGSLVPAAKVREIDKARHRLVMDLAARARTTSAAVARFKAEAMHEIAAFVTASAAEYDVAVGGQKGNVTLMSYDGRYKVVRQVADTLAFDERLQVAKAIIDECVHLWAKGANKNIQALVNHAFQVDKAGRVSTGRVLGLRHLAIDDPKWLQAMAAIADSMKTVASKAYVRFYERQEDGEYAPIALDVAAL